MITCNAALYASSDSSSYSSSNSSSYLGTLEVVGGDNECSLFSRPGCDTCCLAAREGGGLYISVSFTARGFISTTSSSSSLFASALDLFFSILSTLTGAYYTS